MATCCATTPATGPTAETRRNRSGFLNSAAPLKRNPEVSNKGGSVGWPGLRSADRRIDTRHLEAGIRQHHGDFSRPASNVQCTPGPELFGEACVRRQIAALSTERVVGRGQPRVLEGT